MVGKPFAKGRSGNPTGRPKVPDDVKEMARALTPDAIKALGEVVRGKKTPPAARVAAATAIMDRAYGKPTQHIDAHVDLIDRLGLVEQETLAAALEVIARNTGDAAEGAEETHH